MSQDDFSRVDESDTPGEIADAIMARFAPGAAAAAPEFCSHCGGSGDVHSPDGEWRGECTECDVAHLRRGEADTKRLDWLEFDQQKCVFHLGRSWYTRASWGSPYRKRASLREAIDAARAAQAQGGA